MSKKIIQTTEGLRGMLFEELENFLNGSVDHDHVKSVTKITNSILQTVTKDLEAAKMAGDMAKEARTPKSIADLNLNIMLTNNSNAD